MNLLFPCKRWGPPTTWSSPSRPPNWWSGSGAPCAGGSCPGGPSRRSPSRWRTWPSTTWGPGEQGRTPGATDRHRVPATLRTFGERRGGAQLRGVAGGGPESGALRGLPPVQGVANRLCQKLGEGVNSPRYVFTEVRVGYRMEKRRDRSRIPYESSCLASCYRLRGFRATRTGSGSLKAKTLAAPAGAFGRSIH